jgi:hypothetical protein
VLVPASSPPSTPRVIVALSNSIESNASSMLQSIADGPRRYPRHDHPGGGVACVEHNGRSFWLVRASWLEIDHAGAHHGRLLRALSYASGVLLDLPALGRLDRPLSAASDDGAVPSAIELIDRVRQRFRDVGVVQTAVAPIVAAVEPATEALLNRLCGHRRRFRTHVDALQWLVQQQAAQGPRVPQPASEVVPPTRCPIDATVNVVIVDWGADVGYRLLAGLHCAGAPSSAYARRAMAFGFPPRALAQVPPCRATLRWNTEAEQHAAVSYMTDIARADVIVAGVGNSIAGAQAAFVSVLERSWSHSTPVFLVADHRGWSGREPRRNMLERWVADGFPAAPIARFKRGEEADIIARAVSLVPLEIEGESRR